MARTKRTARIRTGKCLASISGGRTNPIDLTFDLLGNNSDKEGKNNVVANVNETTGDNKVNKESNDSKEEKDSDGNKDNEDKNNFNSKDFFPR